jgi:hypothetical protein
MLKVLKHIAWRTIFLAYINFYNKRTVPSRGMSNGHHVQKVIEVL